MVARHDAVESSQEERNDGQIYAGGQILGELHAVDTITICQVKDECQGVDSLTETIVEAICQGQRIPG